MPTCLACSKPVIPWISFGKMPIANGFLTPDQVADEPRYELEVGRCQACTLVQLTQLVEREKMFHAHYAFFSSTSTRMAAHFEQFASGAKTKYLADAADPFVVELGSNDGIMLRHFAQAGIRHLGIEPSANVAQAARDRGVRTTVEFFETELARRIVTSDGRADLIYGANVMCHLPYLHSVADGIRELLHPRGVLIFEDPYLGDIVEKTSYDQIYDEHASYFSLASVSYIFGQHGLEVIDVEALATHGGSMRYTLAHRGARPVTAAVQELRAREEQLRLHEHATFEQLRERIYRSRTELHALLTRLRAEGKRVVGYGATSKSTTVTNFCGLTPDLVEFISDTTPVKQGKLSPGAHIPVRPYADFASRYPDYALLFAWNHAEEILAKESAFIAAGGRFIVYVPTVRVMEP